MIGIGGAEQEKRPQHRCPGFRTDGPGVRCPMWISFAQYHQRFLDGSGITERSVLGSCFATRFHVNLLVFLPTWSTASAQVGKCSIGRRLVGSSLSCTPAPQATQLKNWVGDAANHWLRGTEGDTEVFEGTIYKPHFFRKDPLVLSLWLFFGDMRHVSRRSTSSTSSSLEVPFCTAPAPRLAAWHLAPFS